jgi:hypothetical protein
MAWKDPLITRWAIEKEAETPWSKYHKSLTGNHTPDCSSERREPRIHDLRSAFDGHYGLSLIAGRGRVI